MFPCPHCDQPLEIAPRPKGTWFGYPPGDSKVSLGCGTLLAIGFIVWLCSGGLGTRDEIRELRSEIQRLAKKVDALTPAVAAEGKNRAAPALEIP